MGSEIDHNRGFYPEAAFIVFKRDSNGNYGSKDSYYIESRKINADGRMGAAVPLSIDVISTIAASFTETAKKKLHIDGVMDPRVISINLNPGFENLIWLCASGMRVLYFSEDGEIGKLLPIPNLVFKLSNNGKISVWAVKTRNIKEDTILHPAPFPNTYGKGDVCMGSAKVEWKRSMSEKDLMAEGELKFFNSYFSHGSTYKDYLSKDAKTFPNNKLVKSKVKLKSILKK